MSVTPTRPARASSDAARKRALAAHPRRALDLSNPTSMLDGDLPLEYSLIETAGEAADAALPRDKRVIRVHIVWDCPIKDLELEEVLGRMRAHGAAMVHKVEMLS